MPTTALQVSNLGQIKKADVQFGDLTVLVGPQATGKSIFLELLKLLVDTGAILEKLKRYGLDWNHKAEEFLDIFLGEGMRSVWHKGQSTITFKGNAIDLEKLVSHQRRNKEESLFFIPAQRVLTLGQGWPRPFTDYSYGDPFTVRDFSEKIRSLMEPGFGREASLFPQKQRLKADLRKLLQSAIFSNFELRVDKQGAQKRLVLSSENNKPLPYMVWSAGQREFVPLLMGLYYLLPPTKVPTRDSIKWVVIEELEMGLHPKAISAVMLFALELLSRGYRVCISTHSPHVLDVVWAIKVCQEHKADSRKLLRVFGMDSPRGDTITMADKVLATEARVYYFDPDSGQTHDISNLDPGAEEAAEAGWGGLTEFSGRVADVVADVVNGSTEWQSQ